MRRSLRQRLLQVSPYPSSSPSWAHTLHFPGSLADMCDHVMTLWPMDVNRSQMGHSQVWSIKDLPGEISLLLSLAMAQWREFLQGHGGGRILRMKRAWVLE